MDNFNFHPPCQSSSTGFESRSFGLKILMDFHFSSNSFYFLHTPLQGLAVCGLTYSVCLLFLYVSHAPLDAVKLVLPLPNAYYTIAAIFRLILLLNITPEHNLHSRVKDFITHNSIIIGRLVC